MPKHAFTLTPSVTFPVVGDYVFNGRMDVCWQSQTWLRAENFSHSGDKTLIDLRLGISNDRYGIQFFVNNMTSNNVSTAGVRFFSQVDWFVQSPLVQGANWRQFGVALFAGFWSAATRGPALRLPGLPRPFVLAMGAVPARGQRGRVAQW